MKAFLATTLLALSASAAVLPRADEKVDYTGFKVLRLGLPEGSDEVEAKIEEIAAHVLNPGEAPLDVVVSPDDVDAITALVSESTIINEDVGAALEEEGPLVPLRGEMSISAGSYSLQLSSGS
jgi:hypothetical protein